MNATISLQQTEFAPGEAIRGIVSWHNAGDVRKAEVRLFWQTRGKGSTDVGVAAAETLELPGPSDERTFSFPAPQAPPSFSGRLVSLVWGVELIVEPGGSASRDIVIAPGRMEILLDHPEWLEMPDPAGKEAGGGAGKNPLFRWKSPGTDS